MENFEMTGRRDIYGVLNEDSSETIIASVNKVLDYHWMNMEEENYLSRYRRGIQPILSKTKEIRPEINNICVENHAEEIVAFKNGYFLTQPAYYIARNEAANDGVKGLNEYLYRSGKGIADNELVNWFHTVGKAALYVRSSDDEEAPVKCFAVDPRSAFVVYSQGAGNKPNFGVYIVSGQDNVVYCDVFTKERIYHLLGAGSVTYMNGHQNKTYGSVTSLESVEVNPLGEIPIIEYRYTNDNMGAFEQVLTLLDALNKLQSDRMDGVDQFIQSLIVTTNCQFEDGVSANDIRQNGMINLISVGENKADIKILSEQLDQSQSQIFADNLYDQILTICGMPSTRKGGTSTSDTGAAVLARDGWYQADNVARNTEDLFKRSNRYFDRILLKILKVKGLTDLSLSDFELNFVRNETANAQSKAQCLYTLLSAGMSPELAFAKSGISNDPVNDVAMSKDYLEKRWSNESSN